VRPEYNHIAVNSSGCIPFNLLLDIEIIASPQSGYRKNLPMALTTGNNVMAHHRKPSEASSDDSLNSALEIERMEPKVSELYHLLQVN